MKNKSQYVNNSNFAFRSVYNEELALRFDCVIANDVHHHFPIHIHDSLCIGFISKGKRNIIWLDKTVTINQNEIFVINKNQPHAITQAEPHDYIAITVKGKLDNDIFENIINTNICRDLFLQLFCTLRNNSSDLSENWQNLYAYLSEVHRLSDSLTIQEDFIRKSLEYIHLNYQQQISVEDIAIHACISTYHFCRLFKELMGLSPHNFLRQYRLSQSYKHLRNNTPVFDTAIEIGFYDSSHFIKTFHSYMAVSPKKYQESITKQ